MSPALLAQVLSLAASLGIVQDVKGLYHLLNELYLNAKNGLIRSGISWTGYGWNCIVGCTVCSAGCSNCYADTGHSRRHRTYEEHQGNWNEYGKPMPRQYAKPFSVIQLLTERLGKPLRTSRPGRVFVNSSSDVFHSEVPLEYVQTMFLVMGACPHLTFQILTKRPERMAELAESLPWFPNIEMGVTIEDAKHLQRAEILKGIPAAVKWISAEPLLSSLKDIDLEGIDWVVVGGETGEKEQKIRPAHPDWYRELRDKCKQMGTAFFFKQTGDWVHESQLGDTGLTLKTKGRPVHLWPDGTKSYRFGRVVKHDVLDGRKHQDHPKSSNELKD